MKGARKNRVSIVVQRWHSSVTGGSERLAGQYASLLKDSHEVEIWTTCALETEQWANALEEGASVEDGITVRRFAVTGGRKPAWHALHDLLVEYRTVLRTAPVPWSRALQEEWIRTQGPRSEGLEAHIAANQRSFDTIIYFTYLYPTTYYGSLHSDPERSILVPTLHDEDAAYLPVFGEMASRFRLLLWNTEPERALGMRLWGERPGTIVSVAVDIPEMLSPRAEHGRSEDSRKELKRPYILYCGRIDPGKGCDTMMNYFARFKREEKRDLDLVLTGSLQMKLPSRSDIRYAGFVSEREKIDLMKRAVAFVMPSLNESLSIVTLEAMAVETPFLADERNSVLAWHLERSKGGIGYQDYASFRKGLMQILNDNEFAQALGVAGRIYVDKNYSRSVIRRRLIGAIEGETL